MRKDSFYYVPSIKVLQETSLFSKTKSEALDDILNHFTPLTLPKKSTISFSEIEQFFFVVIKGRVKISQLCVETGREYIAEILTEGDVFDTIGLLYSKDEDMLVETIDVVWLLKTPVKKARELLYTHPIFNENVFSYFGQKMYELEIFAKELIFYDTATRLARLIVRYYKEESLDIIEDLSMETLAKMIGSSRKVVNLHMLALKKEGIITTKDNKLCIINEKKLYEKAMMQKEEI